MLVPITDVGSVGLVKDLSPEAGGGLPLAAWTDCENVRFTNRFAEKGSGRSVLFTPTIAPYKVFSVGGEDSTYIMCAGLAKVHAFILGGASGDITRVSGDYTGGQTDQWGYADFNGVPIFNNGIDKPQQWGPPGLSTKLVDLTNWPSAVRAKAVKGYKSHLVALNIDKGGGSVFPRMVKWSHAADPDTVPTSWDETDPAVDAGEVVLVPGDDHLVSCLPLGDVNVLYGETSAWAQRYIGGTFVFGFSQLSKMAGLAGPDAVCEVLRRHFVVTQEDVVLTDGAQIQSIASAKVRRWLRDNVSEASKRLIQAVPFVDAKEVWLLFPVSGTLLDKALVWSWLDDTWSLVDTAGVVAACSVGVLRSSAPDKWESESAETWDGETSKVWDLGLAGSSGYSGSLVLAKASLKVLLVDASAQFEGQDFTSFLERTWLAPVVSGGNVIPYAPNRMKLLSAVWPRIEAPNGTQFTIKVGSQLDLFSPLVWKDPVTYTVGSPKVDVYATGRLFAVRFTHSGPESWKMHGYDLDIEPLGLL